MSIELKSGMKVRIKGTDIEGVCEESTITSGTFYLDGGPNYLTQNIVTSFNAAGLLEEIEETYTVTVTASQAKEIVEEWGDVHLTEYASTYESGLISIAAQLEAKKVEG